MAQFFYWLGNFANVLSLVTLVFSLLTYLKVQAEARKTRDLLRTQQKVQKFDDIVKVTTGVTTQNPVALAFSLTSSTRSIKKDVEDFLKIQRLNMPIEEVIMNGINNNKDIQNFYETVRNKKLELEMAGYTEVHLFFSGPVQAGTIVGCLLCHWKPVKLYHKDQVHGYQYWMPLIKV